MLRGNAAVRQRSTSVKVCMMKGVGKVKERGRDSTHVHVQCLCTSVFCTVMPRR